MNNQFKWFECSCCGFVSSKFKEHTCKKFKDFGDEYLRHNKCDVLIDWYALNSKKEGDYFEDDGEIQQYAEDLQVLKEVTDGNSSLS